jgi:ABC-type sugar transport system ATPase subunit
MPSITFDHVTKSFGPTRVVEDFHLDVPDGELLVLVGGSGSGKSTILRMLAGLETVTSGRVLIGDRDVTELAPRDRDVAMVFQDYALYPHMTVRRNLSLGLELRRVPRDEIARRVAWVAGVLGLEPLLERRPRQLSGGQRQRVAMGRAMVREPAAFLFDEPLSNLDAALRAQMRVEIGALQRRLGTTTIYVTHDQVEAMTLGDRIVVLAHGVVQQVGRPIDLYRTPANRFVAGFIGTPAMNFLPFSALGPRPRAAGERVAEVGVRPEDIELLASAEGDAPRARVVLVERLGGTSHVHLDLGPHRIVAVVSGDRLPDVGTEVGVRVPPERAYLFAADGRALVQDR